jgi:hypothetical protein
VASPKPLSTLCEPLENHHAWRRSVTASTLRTWATLCLALVWATSLSRATICGLGTFTSIYLSCAWCFCSFVSGPRKSGDLCFWGRSFHHHRMCYLKVVFPRPRNARGPLLSLSRSMGQSSCGPREHYPTQSHMQKIQCHLETQVYVGAVHW